MLKSINKSFVKVISFDATNTLFKLKVSPGFIYSSVGKDFGLSLNAQDIDLKFRDHFNTLEKELPCYGYNKCGPKRWWDEIIYRCCNLDINETSKEFAGTLYNELSTSKYYTLINDKTPEILKYLKDNGYKLVIVSNSDSRLRSVLPQLLGDNHFDDYFISSELGISKPDHGVFSMLCQRLSCSPRDILHIGDSLVKDYQCIIDFGGQGLLLNNSNDQISIKSLNNLYYINKSE
uniref:Haloacid dehalogenase-like hydrolase domain-containing protein 3 n=1 Tax=Strongyloides venezuelensis TaxID=75913 RepID=A0A0K0EZG6_STRVS